MEAADDQERLVLTPWKRRGPWILGGALLLLCLGYVISVWREGLGKESDRWMAEERARGERFSIAELFPEGFGDPATNRTADLHRLIDGLSDAPLQFGGSSFRDIKTGVAIPYWQETIPVGSLSGATNSWADLQAAVDHDEKSLQDLYRLLSTPDRDFGDVLHVASKIRPDYVRKRSLAQQLTGVINIELNRGRPRAAADALAGLMDFSQWHPRHVCLVNYMITVAIRNMALSAHWSVLQQPGWTAAQLADWQRAWETNGMVSQLKFMTEVERAIALETFDYVATNRNGLRHLGSGGSFPSKTVWALRRVFLDDRDKMFTLRFFRINIDAAEAGAKARSRAAHRNASGGHAALKSEMTTGTGRYCLLSHVLLYPVDRSVDVVFQYEVRREMLVTAIALRRYFQKKGGFPASVKALVPDYLAKEPVDWMNGGVLRYARGTNGWFHLRSTGEDGIDDLGGGDDVVWWQTPEQRRQAGPP